MEEPAFFLAFPSEAEIWDLMERPQDGDVEEALLTETLSLDLPEAGEKAKQGI